MQENTDNVARVKKIEKSEIAMFVFACAWLPVAIALFLLLPDFIYDIHKHDMSGPDSTAAAVVNIALLFSLAGISTICLFISWVIGAFVSGKLAFRKKAFPLWFRIASWVLFAIYCVLIICTTPAFITVITWGI